MKINAQTIEQLLVFLLVALCGMAYVSSTETRGHFYQERMAPVLMLVCGQGFLQPDLNTRALAELRNFFGRGADPSTTMDCSAFPLDKVGTNPVSPWHNSHFLLLMCIALCWSLFGIAWSALTPLFGVFYGLSGLFAYNTFRLCMGRCFALAALVLFVTSPMCLYNLTLLRDYAKVPFFFFSLFLMVYLLKVPVGRRRLYSIMAAAGLILGLGQGFRYDVYLFLPPMAITVLFLSSGSIREGFVARLGAVGILAGVFILIGLMLPNPGEEGTITAQRVVVGSLTPYNETIGVTGAPYEIGHVYGFDDYGWLLINDYWQRYRGVDEPIQYRTHEYDDAGKAYILELARWMPADFAIRGLTSAFRLLDEIPFGELDPNAENYLPQGLSNVFLERLYLWRFKIVHIFYGWGIFIAALSWVILTAYRLQYGVFAILTVLYFLGMTSLMFHVRHFAHLEFLMWWSIGFMFQQFFLYLRAMAVPSSRKELLRKSFSLGTYRGWPAIRAVALPLCTITVLGLAAEALIVYQQYKLKSLIEDYLAANRIPVELSVTDGYREGRAILRSDDWPALPEIELVEPGESLIDTAYLLTVWQPDESNRSNSVDVLYRYKTTSGRNFSKKIRVPFARGESIEPTLALFPVHQYRSTFWNAMNEFEGIDIARDDLPRLKAIYRLDHIEEFPILLQLILLPGWSSRGLHLKPYDWRAEQLESLITQYHRFWE